MVMWSVKIRPNPGSTSFAARSLSEVGFGEGRMSKLDQVVSSILAAETAMDLSPGWALARRGRAGWFYVKSGPPAKRPDHKDRLWRVAEVQYASQIGPFGRRNG